jgi:hypothetical protein
MHGACFKITLNILYPSPEDFFKGMDSPATLQSITSVQQTCKVVGRLLRLWDAINVKSKFADPLINIDGVIYMNT